MNTLLEMKNVTKYFGSGDTVSKALNGVSFTMGRGEFTAIRNVQRQIQNYLIYFVTVALSIALLVCC